MNRHVVFALFSRVSLKGQTHCENHTKHNRSRGKKLKKILQKTTKVEKHWLMIEILILHLSHSEDFQKT